MAYVIRDGAVIEESRELKVLTTDVVVAGGGVAGFAAAVAAARTGARVILVESRSCLGGVATQAMMAALVAGRYAQGISRELIDTMTRLGGAPAWDDLMKAGIGTVSFDPEVFKQAALDMTLKAGVEILFYTQVCEPVLVEGRVRGVVVEGKAGRFSILAKVTVDCTGDADLAYRAGVPCTIGRAGDHKTRPLTLLFRMGNVDVRRIARYAEANPGEIQPQYLPVKAAVFNGGEEVIARLSGFYKLVEEAKAKGELYDEIHYFRLENLMINRGTAFCNTARVYYLNGTDPRDLTRAEIEARAQIRKIFAFAKAYIPGCENAFIIDVSSSLGVRETRRIVGEYTVTDEDAYGDRIFEDGFVTLTERLVRRPCPVNLDVHMPEPIEGSEQDWLERYPDKVPFERHSFQLSYRCLIPKGVGGLLVAGRTISVSHLLDSYTRNMIPCMRFGQSAGAAAGLCAGREANPVELPFADLRAELVRQGLSL
jgi:hypothetical protein